MRIDITITMLSISFFLTTTSCSTLFSNQFATAFDENESYEYVHYQMNLGARIPKSQAHKAIENWLEDTLYDNGWDVSVDKATVMDHELKNIIGKWGKGEEWIILGAHYDNRIFADNDPIASNHYLPVPGANDGASGVAVLLELSKVIPKLIDNQRKTIWLVFFDLEDDGNIAGYDWIMGSRHFVENLNKFPDKVVIIDMIGDRDLNIYKEFNSNQYLTNNIWNIADELGYKDYFIPELKYHILDDHIPFIEKGIQAIDIIDFDYPYWHTIHDTTDKIAPESLNIVGDVLLNWLQK